jgi:hypothetical protein
MKLSSLALNALLICSAEAALRGQKDSTRSLETNNTSTKSGHHCPEGYTQKHGGKFETAT